MAKQKPTTATLLNALPFPLPSAIPLSSSFVLRPSFCALPGYPGQFFPHFCENSLAEPKFGIVVFGCCLWQSLSFVFPQKNRQTLPLLRALLPIINLWAMSLWRSLSIKFSFFWLGKCIFQRQLDLPHGIAYVF